MVSEPVTDCRDVIHGRLSDSHRRGRVATVILLRRVWKKPSFHQRVRDALSLSGSTGLVVLLAAGGVVGFGDTDAVAADAPRPPLPVIWGPPQIVGGPANGTAGSAAAASIGTAGRAMSRETPRLDIDAELAGWIGQMIMVGFQGRRLSDAPVQALLGDIRSGHVGGVIFMPRNIKALREVRRMIAAFRDAAPAGRPLLVGVDQEGGAVQRIPALGDRRRRFPSHWRIAQHGSPPRAHQIYARLARQIGDMGFNLNFGPVVDLRINPRNPVIARMNRSFGRDPLKVSQYAKIFVNTHRDAGVMTALKHFPGHGSSLADSHSGFVNITRPWRDVELVPYARLIASGHADMVMVGHLYHAALAPTERYPATLSKRAIDGVLRTELGFDGVVVTDDLAMGAIRRSYEQAEAIAQAVHAGNDIILITGSRNRATPLHVQVRHAIVAAIADKRVTRARIAKSGERIMRLKARLQNYQRQAAQASNAAKILRMVP